MLTNACDIIKTDVYLLSEGLLTNFFCTETIPSGFLPGIFFRGEYIVMQISFVMLLFWEPNFREGQSLQGGANCLRGVPPCLPVEESQPLMTYRIN